MWAASPSRRRSSKSRSWPQCDHDGSGRIRVAIAPGRYTLAVRRHGFAPWCARSSSLRTGGAGDRAHAECAPLEPVTVPRRASRRRCRRRRCRQRAVGDALRRRRASPRWRMSSRRCGRAQPQHRAQIGKPRSRLLRPRVLVLENGSRLEDYSWSDETARRRNGVRAPHRADSRPASVLYGSRRLGRRHQRDPGAAARCGRRPGFMRTGFTLSAASTTSSWVPARVSKARATTRWRVRGDRRHASNLHTPAGELDKHRLRRLQRRGGGGMALAVRQLARARVIHYGGDSSCSRRTRRPAKRGAGAQADERSNHGPAPMGNLAGEVRGSCNSTR